LPIRSTRIQHPGWYEPAGSELLVIGYCRLAIAFALWLSPHILANVKRVLEELFKWDQEQADAYLTIITAAAGHSGGALLEDVPRTA
jgi:hypothetical protein